MKIATYNVNSVNARMENLERWLKSSMPDVVLLQEIKCEFNNFPLFELQSLGYNCAVLGQKSYNGTAILSKKKITVTQENLPDFIDNQARYLEALTTIDNQTIRVASVYVPNGNPPYNNAKDESKFIYKLQWMDAFLNHVKKLATGDEKVIIGGDFNVIMSESDVYDVKPFINNALFRREVQEKLKQLSFVGFYDAFRELHPDVPGYTFWDYIGGAFSADRGMRIDYMFLSAPAADALKSCEVNKTPRGEDKPSDHTPLEINLL
ncbi:MAG: exodeoxyribonuclease III [Alphaproteobacteria bacterium]|nr:exodeoxyribonuclease III [Alphaproteobacteria bacterium]